MAGCVRDGRVHLSVCDIGDLAVEVTCRVANTGRRRGKEVAQLYVGDPEASVARPPRELKAFAKVDLDAGETETLTFRLDARDLSYWSPTAADWVLEAGEFALAIGASSRDLRLRITIDIAAPPARVALDGMATLDEWLADPDGAALLLEAVGTDEQGRPGGIVGDDELRAVVGNFPIGALTAFPGSGLDQGTVDELVQRLRVRGAGGRRAPARPVRARAWRPSWPGG
jgi:beta-glucosidase